MNKKVIEVLLDKLYEKQADIDDCITTIKAAIEANDDAFYLRVLDDIEDIL